MVICCRYCGGGHGEVVLDLGRQPACDDFPAATDAGPGERTPLRMWYCAACGLAQLVEDPAAPERALGVEPAAMRDQARTVLARLTDLGLLDGGTRVAEYGSPHGGSWADLLPGLVEESAESTVDLILDVYGLLHEPDQAAALRNRVARLAPGGALVCQLHPLDTVVRLGQWNDLRHGHFAYWSVSALTAALARHGLGVRHAWLDPMAGGTAVLLATRVAGRVVDRARISDAGVEFDEADAAAVRALSDRARIPDTDFDFEFGEVDVAALRALGEHADTDAERLRDWLSAERAAGRTVLGYGAASRSVPLLNHARVDASLLPAIGDASPGKHGLRIPGTDIPVIPPAELVARRPDSVLLFLPDLLAEVRRALPEVGRWVVAADLAPVS